MTEKTEQIALNLPEFDTSPWHQLVNDNFRNIDAIMKSLVGISKLKGRYLNSTSVEEGEQYFDPETSMYYRAITNFVTMPAPTTFSEERTEHPERWETTDLQEFIDQIQLIVDQAAQSETEMIAGDGLSGGGSIAENRTFDVDSTVVRTSRAITGGGIATGGGDLSENRTITVPKSTSAQALAGTDDSTVMTPVRVQEKINAEKDDLTVLLDKATYDPQGVGGDAFNASNMESGNLPMARMPILEPEENVGRLIGRNQNSGDGPAASVRVSSGLRLLAGNLTIQPLPASFIVEHEGPQSQIIGGITGELFRAASDDYAEKFAFGVDQEWVDVTSSRERQTTYQNTTNKPITVSVHGNGGSQIDNRNFEVSVDASTWVIVARSTGANEIFTTTTFVVPVGHYYRFNASAGTINRWAELR